jgi:hypothetical protein
VVVETFSLDRLEQSSSLVDRCVRSGRIIDGNHPLTHLSSHVGNKGRCSGVDRDNAINTAAE